MRGFNHRVLKPLERSHLLLLRLLEPLKQLGLHPFEVFGLIFNIGNLVLDVLELFGFLSVNPINFLLVKLVLIEGRNALLLRNHVPFAVVLQLVF